jgi:MoxR-like ATPase
VSGEALGPAGVPVDVDPLTPAESGALLTRVRAEIGRVIVGQQRVVERVLVALLAGGHCLLEGAPGLGKTRLLVTLATTLGGSFNRIQFTPDLLPSDIVGTRIWRQQEGRFSVELGPVFANFVLTDEINRAPAKVQSALLEVMAEKQVTIGGETFAVDRPFLVLATQNPIESEGVYQLPEAQRDRFLMKVPVDYPAGPHEELEIVRRAAGDAVEPRRVVELDQVRRLQATTRAVHGHRRVAYNAAGHVMATRDPQRYGLDGLAGLIAFGASPRASIGLVEGARAMALLRGRGAVEPQDVYDIGYDVLNHRLVLSFDAVADGVTVDEVLYHLLTTIPAPTLGGGVAPPRHPAYPPGPPALPPAAPYPPAGSGAAPTSTGERLQAAGPYGVTAITGEFQGQRDAARGRDRRPPVQRPAGPPGPAADGSADDEPVPAELADPPEALPDDGADPAGHPAAHPAADGPERPPAPPA